MKQRNPDPAHLRRIERQTRILTLPAQANGVIQRLFRPPFGKIALSKREIATENHGILLRQKRKKDKSGNRLIGRKHALCCADLPHQLLRTVKERGNLRAGKTRIGQIRLRIPPDQRQHDTAGMADQLAVSPPVVKIRDHRSEEQHMPFPAADHPLFHHGAHQIINRSVLQFRDSGDIRKFDSVRRIRNNFQNLNTS